MLGHRRLFTALAGVVGINQVQAAFFVYNHAPLIRTRLDPIVDSGKVSGHVHLFSGSANVEADGTFASFTSADCTTAPLQADKSGYWAPQLYYKHRDGTYTALSGDGLVTYWKYLGLKPGEKYATVPDDFRMLAGDVKRDHLDTTLASHNAVIFQCFGPGYDYMFPYIPADFECETIRPQVHFPSCWNGVDSYKADNSHVSYPTGADFEHGPCPAGFKRIPGLFVETYYNPRLILGDTYEWYPGCLVLANGDNFGLSFHADWLNGFPSGLLTEAFESCGESLLGDVKACPVLAASVDEAKARGCNVKGHVVNEPVGLQKRLQYLPGNNMEYNSSRLANKPKVDRPGYTEQAKVVTLTEGSGGRCRGRECTDYAGGVGVPADIGGLPSITVGPPSKTTTAAGGGGGRWITIQTSLTGGPPITTTTTAGGGIMVETNTDVAYTGIYTSRSSAWNWGGGSAPTWAGGGRYANKRKRERLVVEDHE